MNKKYYIIGGVILAALLAYYFLVYRKAKVPQGLAVSAADRAGAQTLLDLLQQKFGAGSAANIMSWATEGGALGNVGPNCLIAGKKTLTGAIMQAYAAGYYPGGNVKTEDNNAIYDAFNAAKVTIAKDLL